MTILRRGETPEAMLLPKHKDAGYKIVLMNDGEILREAITRAMLADWPVSKIWLICFVSASSNLAFIKS